MKTFYKISFSLLAISLIVFGCGKDFLEAPVNGQLAKEDFYKTDDDVNSAVVAIYDILTWNNNFWGWVSPVLIKTLPSDEGTAGGASDTDQPDYDSLDDYDYDSANPKIEGFWNLAYWGIYRANLVIDNVEPDTDFKKQAIAEAHALRAYNYMDLVAFFGGVPILLTELTPSEYNQSKATVEAVYAQIETDLSMAIDGLPLKSEYSAGDKFRVSKGTAQALLGKAYLYQKKYTDAARSFDDVINSGEYFLASDFASIFRAEGEFGPGSLFEAVFTNEVGYNWGTNPWDTGQSERIWEANMHIQLMGPRENEFGNDSNTGMIEGWGFNLPGAKLYEAYNAAGDMVRRDATVISEADWNASGGAATGAAYDYNGYLRLKYGTFPDESGDPSVPQNYGTNWRLLRYADVLLMAAEANALSGNEAMAIDYLNQVRERVNLAPVSPSGNALIEAIVNERFLELAFEGFRLIDLIRWDMAADNIEGFQEKHKLFPIPQNEILRSPDLQQNPGW